jgi:hypothetical protein
MDTLLAQRQRDRTVITISEIQTVANCSGPETLKFTPFDCAPADTINRQQPISSLITKLFRLGGPLNIAGLVVPVYIYSIQRMFSRRSISDARQKFTKRGKAKFYSAAAIQFVRRFLGIFTSTFGLIKRFVFGRLATALWRCVGRPVHGIVTLNSHIGSYLAGMIGPYQIRVWAAHLILLDQEVAV